MTELSRQYESIIIFDGHLPEDAIKVESQKVHDLLTKHGAFSISTDDWGKKKLAFLMKKKNHGVYKKYVFETENSKLVEKLSAELSIIESVIRFQSHRIDLKQRKFKGSPNRGGLIDSDVDDSEDDDLV
jgi:small subunit ribosomal protein S6